MASSSSSSFSLSLDSKDLSHSSGEIHVIVGPMFAGKTTSLLRRIKSELNAARLIFFSSHFSFFFSEFSWFWVFYWLLFCWKFCFFCYREGMWWCWSQARIQDMRLTRLWRTMGLNFLVGRYPISCLSEKNMATMLIRRYYFFFLFFNLLLFLVFGLNLVCESLQRSREVFECAVVKMEFVLICMYYITFEW